MRVYLDASHVPGRIRRVRSMRIRGIWHWGVEGIELDENDQPTIWHAQKNDSLRCTPYEEFSSGHPAEILWTPDTSAQQDLVIQRLEEKQGLHWNLVSANCEQIVRWAVEGKGYSEQLAIAALVVLLIAAVLFVVSRGAA